MNEFGPRPPHNEFDQEDRRPPQGELPPLPPSTAEPQQPAGPPEAPGRVIKGEDLLVEHPATPEASREMYVAEDDIETQADPNQIPTREIKKKSN